MYLQLLFTCKRVETRLLITMFLPILFLFLYGVNGFVYKGTYISMFLNTSSGFSIFPDDKFIVSGRLLFLDDQHLSVNNYSGTIEFIHFNNSCYTVYQTIEYFSCPRIFNNAFRSCLKKVSKHHESQLRINSSIENGVLLEITNPKPNDSGVYFIRVQLENNKTDVFGIPAFIYSFNMSNEVNKSNFDDVTTSLYTSSHPSSQTITPIYLNEKHEPICHTVKKDENVYELLLGLHGNITDDIFLDEDSELLKRVNIPTTTNNYIFKPYLDQRNRKFLIIVISISIILLILLVLIGSIINNIIRRHFSSSRRIYRPKGNSESENIELTCGENSVNKNNPLPKKPNRQKRSSTIQRETSLETIKEEV
uniref:Envelope glycoprotein I n=2 Tax=Canid alphaherpesvirus 1 TaxID=170325 RepID=O41525_9ALPH|nr:cUS7 [Canid alphaherpesvirus 1]AAK51063.1 glycoprotein I [Canid alphaherpesvirus 1]BAA33765.1 glycoprotein I [Canid alphaherpesvirus 1]